MSHCVKKHGIIPRVAHFPPQYFLFLTFSALYFVTYFFSFLFLLLLFVSHVTYLAFLKGLSEVVSIFAAGTRGRAIISFDREVLVHRFMAVYVSHLRVVAVQK
jgi:hypothetical protein